jgi:hypothetical protein
MELVTNTHVQADAAAMLYHLALDCAERKVRQTCDFNCFVCASNLEIYGVAKKDALLMRRNAELEVEQRLRVQHAYKMQELESNRKAWKDYRESKILQYIAFVCFLVFILFLVYLHNRFNPAPRQIEPPQGYESELPIIVETLGLMIEKDNNGDGLINCIDFAIQFYEKYPYKDNIRIIVNHNREINFHHLFVYVAGVAIEPMALVRPRYIGQSLQVGVGNYWTGKYNPRYDSDVTEHWSAIRVNQYRW